MVVFAIDDERLARELLVEAIKDNLEEAEIYDYADAEAALADVDSKKPNIIFTDINMPMMNGLEFVRRLKTINNKVNIIFVTGYSEYTRDAISLHASGYVTKPVTSQKVKDELDNLLYPVERPKKGLYVHTFGNFDLMMNGEAVKFRREKCKELMALLIDRAGESLNNEQIASYLYPENAYDAKTKNQVTTVAADLRKTIEELGVDRILIKKWGQMQLDPSQIMCDAYDYWAGEPYAINLFKGEYLENYSWGEESKAKFYWDNNK